MGTGVQGLKHAAKVQEWSVRIAECRGSGIGVKAWCREHGIALKTYYNWEWQIVKEATQQYALAAPAPAGMLVQVNPDAMASDDVNAIETVVTIRHAGYHRQPCGLCMRTEKLAEENADDRRITVKNAPGHRSKNR